MLKTINRMKEMAHRPFRKITVQDVVNSNTRPTCRLQVGRITADELAVRLSKRVYEIHQLPPKVVQNQSAQKIISIYTTTCHELFKFTDLVERLRGQPSELEEWKSIYTRSLPFFKRFNPKIPFIETSLLKPTSQDLVNIKYGSNCLDPSLELIAEPLSNIIVGLLQDAIERHKPIMMLWAQEYSKMALDPHLTQDAIQTWLTKFHWQRIAVRILIGHCVGLSNPMPLPNSIGIFCTKVPVKMIVQEAIEMASEVCLMTYGCVPPVKIVPGTEKELFYIPSHLQHIVFELVKNAMRAVIDKKHINNDKDLEEIEVKWTHEKDVSIY
jgi:pyruvate dehydrogenase kinase 2/3/4